MAKDFLSVSEVLAMLPMVKNRSTIQRWAQRGKFAGAFRSPTGRWVIPKSAVERLLKESNIPPDFGNEEP